MGEPKLTRPSSYSTVNRGWTEAHQAKQLFALVAPIVLFFTTRIHLISESRWKPVIPDLIQTTQIHHETLQTMSVNTNPTSFIPSNGSGHHSCFLWGLCCSYLIVLCCPIMYLYILSSVIWCPLRSPHKSHVHFVFTYSSFQERSCLINIICVCLRFVVSNTYCVVLFILIVIVLCAKCCQSLWIVYYWLSLRYSLTFIYFPQK